MIQSGNWRGARDAVWELVRDTGNSLVQNKEHLKFSIKKLRYRSGPNSGI